MSAQTFDSLFVGASELAVLMRGADWSRTAVGSPEHWPQSVRAIIRMMLTSRYAMWMGWGPDLTFFYNDAYAHMSLGAKHPWALGKDASDVWAEIWNDIGPRIAHVLATGEATWDEGLLLFLERSGFPEETYHTFSYSPMHDDDGRVAGMFCVVTEDTTRVIGARRLALLREFGSQLASSQTTDDVWNAVERSLAGDSRDAPFTLTYVVDERAGHAKLVASTNVRADDPIASPTIPLDDALWPTRLVTEGPPSGSVTIDLPPALAWPSGPWPKAPGRAIVLPIAQQGHARAAGIFIAGLNPYRPMDAEYESFIRLYVGQIAAGLASAQAYVAERRRAEALAQLDRAKTTFFSNVSHELRTPLTLMIGPVADALASPGHALSAEALALVHRNGLRLRRLVNALLDFSRIEAGRIDASYEPVDLGQYTSEIVSGFRSAVERAGLQFIVECGADGGMTFVDRDMWEKIVLNLVSNAFKFTFEGEIRVSVERRDDRMELRVRDTGRGIPGEELTRVFERFHRVEGAVGRSHEGTGIGLALVQELVKLHGGTIQVESEIDRGTTFTVSVPQGSSHLPPEQIRAERRSASTALGADTFVEDVGRWLVDDAADVTANFTTDTAVGRARRPERIVLADDNADMRAYLKSLLGSIWTVDLAADGREALALARARMPDLIITDVMMPTLDGFGLLRELRADERIRHVPVMMLSARAGEEARIDGFQAGADDYLVKPFTARELLAKVEARLLHARIRHIEERTTRRLAAVFAQAPLPIAILRGPDHVFEVANDACVALVNRPVIGQRVADALPELMDLNVIELLDRVYSTGEPFAGRPVQLMLNRGVDGRAEAAFFDVVVQPLFGESGSIEGLAAIAFEVTELANARQAAEAANRAKDEFLAMLGHELRNPLAPILTAVQLMRHRGTQSGERERTVIERQVRHLVGLVDDLLDVSRITRGKVRLSPRPIELNEIVAKAIELASPLLEDQQHRLEIDVPRVGLGVMADSVRLAQVVTNLLTNAAKYTPAGGQIVVRAWSEGDQVALSVRDTGIGIDRRMLPHVFDLFTQDRQAIDRAQGGLGLGLALVRSFVTLHGGTVSANSDGQGLGSEFVVRLPKVVVDTALQDKPRAIEPPVASPNGARVLVVDDNEDAAAMLAEALTGAGHFVATAHDGPAALTTAGAFKPDIALLDLGLPVMDGFELARQFRSSIDLQDTRLVAITGYGQEHDRERSASAGFDAHLVKPVDLEQLTQLVQAWTSRPEKTV